MGLGESLFDLTYLILAIGMGVRLLLEKNKNAKLFGLMAVVLGGGDAFHLIPRVISHMSPLGFEAHELSLSYGKMITGITMTIFYLLFYFYYREISKDKNDMKKWTIIILSVVRIILVILPQNKWSSGGSYTMGLVRNIPFLIMGILLIVWSYKNRRTEGLKHMGLLIFLSFLFYLPVVIWVDKIPALGSLMVPKTLAYIFIVWEGFKYSIKDFSPDNLFNMSITYAVMGLCAGVFYREFTKYYAFIKITHLGKMHVHTLVLGMLVMAVFYLLSKNMNQAEIEDLKKPIIIYNVGLVFTMANMMLLGIYEVVSEGSQTLNSSAMEGISGLGHIILGFGLLYTLLKLKKLSVRSIKI
ncbi:DUF2871 domain-containing protein [Peptoniphilus sp. GNH]|nr:DUF2871 domain-containing protein [Peptoniphilus sp. GNH]